jgi:2-polyprenyl-6-methoxyphenol hydroxylase-like FAD-dependent oxidoreductase
LVTPHSSFDSLSPPFLRAATMASEDTTSDVIVVGAGPVGLLLAGDLASSGHRVTLLERRPSHISNLSRAFGIHARALEQLDARGLADSLVNEGQRLGQLRLFARFALDLTRLPSRFPHVLILPQYRVESSLRDRAIEAKVNLRYEAELVNLTQDDKGVVAEVKTASEGTNTLTATYLVGTDGLHSTVRSVLGLPFPGHSVIRSIVLADVKLDEKPEDVLSLWSSKDACCFIAPFGDGWYRVMGWTVRRQAVDDHEPITLDEVKEIARLSAGTDWGMRDARWLSRFHSDERQVSSYRQGRVFLAGDAAHIHSPAGAQGLNTGLQDAANLSWKISTVLRNEASDALLDTYHAERYPIGKQVLRFSGALVRLATAHTVFRRAMRTVVTWLVSHSSWLRNKVASRLTGIGISYPSARGRGAHPLVGERAPDIPLRDGTRLYEALRDGKFVLVKAGDDCWPGPPSVQENEHHMDIMIAPTRRADDSRVTMLVRPDGYVAWATEDNASLSYEVVHEALVAAIKRQN